MPGLSPLFWMSRRLPFTDVSVLDENRIAPRYASNYSIAVREVSAGIAGSKENFFNPPRCDCTPSLPFLSIFGGPDENGVGWNHSSRQLLKRDLRGSCRFLGAVGREITPADSPAWPDIGLG